MQYSPLVERIAGEGADAWLIHYAARSALERGEDVILLSVGDPDLDTPAPVVERAIEGLRARRHALHAGHGAAAPARGDRTGASRAYRPAGGRRQRDLSGGGAERTVRGFDVHRGSRRRGHCAGAFVSKLSRHSRGIGRANGAGAVAGAARDSASIWRRSRRRSLPRTRAMFFATPNNPSGVILSQSDLAAIGELARRHSLWVVADEVYAGLAPGGRVPSLAA